MIFTVTNYQFKGGKLFNRQSDNLSCGYFAIKDARLMRELSPEKGATRMKVGPTFTMEIPVFYKAELPLKSLRLVQDTFFLERRASDRPMLSDEEKLTVINAKGETLLQFIERYKGERQAIDPWDPEASKLINTKIDRLEKKYLDVMEDIFRENSIEDIVNWAREYDAACITVKGLESRHQEWLARQQKQAYSEEKMEIEAPTGMSMRRR